MSRYVTHTAEETIALGSRFAGVLQGGEVIAFTGGLGAGKTTFCRGVAQGLQCIDAVSSPTFSIVNYYRGLLPFAHFDAYRIHSEDDLEAAGFYTYHAAGAVVAIEWSENLAAFLEEPLIHVCITTLSENSRAFNFKGAPAF